MTITLEEQPAVAAVRSTSLDDDDRHQQHQHKDGGGGGSSTTTSPAKPCRNLTQAFEALCVQADAGGGVDDDHEEKKVELLVSPGTQPKTTAEVPLISPTGVAEFAAGGVQRQETTAPPTPESSSVSTYASAAAAETLPFLHLHADLRRELSLHTVQRVSAYSILHDINKEAAAMAAHDPLSAAAVAAPDAEEGCPLVLSAAAAGRAAIMPPARLLRFTDPTRVGHACIDEERWLLSAIASRTAEETAAGQSSTCPATFLQAMGEKEYSLQLTNTGTRTQLWKPSRSWWEAKSGKNPWIEPASHNKRWRYLWPLIHYHKFLAKCIKKLKRNGVDVKQAVSPVSVFLREEVCAVSDHLAAVSLFDSDQWMACLEYFHGWTCLDDASVGLYRHFVARQPLRPLDEPGDVESPVLRSQIDENFLRTIAQQRRQLLDGKAPGSVGGSSHKKGRVPVGGGGPTSVHTAPAPVTSLNPSAGGPPPVYPRGSPPDPVPRQIHGVRRPRYGYPYGYHHGHGWDPATCVDASSVHSEISMNSYPYQQHQQYDYHHYPPPPLHPAHYPPPYGSEHSQSTAGYHTMDPRYYDGWMDPNVAYHMQQDGYYGSPSHPPSPHGGMVYPAPLDATHEEFADVAVAAETEQTPFKYDPEKSMNMSPYWSHLDRATMAITATPAKTTPSTPRRGTDKHAESEAEQNADGAWNHAQPPLLRQQYYGGYGYEPGAGYGPPSPATQFMMSPQASFAYQSGYGVSPRRRSTPRACTSLEKTPTTGNLVATSTPVHKIAEDRNSPSTVETTTESESMIEPQQT